MQTYEWEELLHEAPEDHLPGKRAVAEVIRLRREIESLRADCYQTVIDPRGHEDMTPNGVAHHVALDYLARLTHILEGGPE